MIVAPGLLVEAIVKTRGKSMAAQRRPDQLGSAPIPAGTGGEADLDFRKITKQTHFVFAG